MTTFTNTLLTTLADDSEAKKFAGVLAPIVPVLWRLPVETAVRVVQSLASNDPNPGLAILREHSSEVKWQAIVKALDDKANQAVLRQFQDEQAVRDVLWKLSVVALGLLVPQILP